ncbi:Uncharacterized protein conserved in bacteria [Urinicoccus massiliensis]|uniref:Uncharacterized protein conserved in bacteria n=1 Tax=Urinicoccus massiliensis TaxID=1723382 RepID=A0A8H2M4N4_9FIRM|nr:PC4/YdbC family ssDNA-binding protein [Urinicoccus massiliensis]KGF08578.1 seryl-tRNA synthetase [Tissierellia bacterium S5-A11]VFB16081.1 Uncharacterized protein conserved in bacteria [Urinicoccus massiliensis]
MAFKYELLESLGVLSESASGWTKELNIVSYNDQEGKYDLRQWAPDHEKMAKGITLTKEELVALRDLLNSLDLD